MRMRQSVSRGAPGRRRYFSRRFGSTSPPPPPSCTGPVGRTLHVLSTLGWLPREGWWCWDVPGQEDPLHFVQEPLKQVQHRVCESLRCHSSRQLEARRPVTFGGLGDGAAGATRRAAMRVASTELERPCSMGCWRGTSISYFNQLF